MHSERIALNINYFRTRFISIALFLKAIFHCDLQKNEEKVEVKREREGPICYGNLFTASLRCSLLLLDKGNKGNTWVIAGRETLILLI